MVYLKHICKGVLLMYKIVVISDTHGDFDILYDIIKRNQAADMFIHLGDGEREYDDVRNLFPEKAFLYVRGNNDWGTQPLMHTFFLNNHKFYLTHGHSFSYSNMESFISSTAAANGCDVALFGHNHVPCILTENGVQLFNPGSPVRPRGMSKPSFGIITINNDDTLKFEIKEYKE